MRALTLLIPMLIAALGACTAPTPPPATDGAPANPSLATSAPRPPELTVLDAGIAPFVDAFNADAGTRRIVIILSPT